MTTTIVRRNGSQPVAQSKNQSLPAISQSTTAALKEASQLGMQLYAQGSDSDILAALDLADAIQQLRDIFDQPEVKSRIESLCDTPLGFRTDKDPKVKNRKTGQYNEPYGWPIIRDAAIEAVLRGLQLAGNQFNIIAGRFYCTKEGFEHLIKKLSFVTEFRPIIGIPVAKNGGVTIDCSATWNQHGKEQSISAQIPIKTTDSSTADQCIGKAKRKFFERCYAAMSGNSMPEGDALDLVEVPTRPQAFAAPTSAPQVVSSAVVSAAEPVATLTDEQQQVLINALERQLTPVGVHAFMAAACQAFGVSQLSDIPAEHHSRLMKTLADAGNRERWDRGCNHIDGKPILSADEIASLLPPDNTEQIEEQDEADSDELQGQLV